MRTARKELIRDSKRRGKKLRKREKGIKYRKELRITVRTGWKPSNAIEKSQE